MVCSTLDWQCATAENVLSRLSLDDITEDDDDPVVTFQDLEAIRGWS